MGAAPLEPWAQPAPAGSARTYSTLSVASLVCGVLCCFPFVTSALAVVLGYLGLQEVGRNPALKGRELAVAGMILGGLGMLSWVFNLLTAFVSD